MEDAGFIIGGYVITFGAMALLAWRTVVRGRQLGREVPDEEKYWL